MPPKQVDIEAALDQQRSRLEESITKLRKALSTWQNWSAEYEAFREELQTLPEDASREDMLAAGLSIEGSLLDEREVKDLLGDKAGIRRSRQQVIKAVSDRIDYVDKNVCTVEKKVEGEEGKLEKLLIVSYPGEKTEEGLDFMEITEYLDEDDNIINATVNGKDPNAALRNIDADTLGQFEKFIDKAAKESAITNPSIPLKSGSGPAETTASASVQPLAKPEPEPAPSTTAPTAGGPSAESAQKTSAEASTTASSSTVQAPESVSKPVAEGKSTSSGLDPSVDGASEVDEEFMANESGGFVKILPDPEIPESSWVQTVPGESEADAALRKEMLEYSMSEIGDVVAELNLEESGDFYGYEGYSDEEDYDDEDDSEATSEEDEYGRTVNKRVVTASYRKEMEELQQMIKDREAKLESKMEQKKPSVQQLSPQPPRPSPTARSKSSDKEAKPKKGVRFSEELDISPAPAAVDALPSPPSPPPAVPFQIAQLHDIAPDEEDALPYLTELMARTGMFNAGPMDPTFEAPPPVAQPKEKGPSLFKREKSSPSAVSATEQPSAAAPKAPTSTLSKSVLERPPVPAKSVPSSALSENVLERSPVTAAIPPSAPAPPKKLSRFKQAQLAANSSSPSSSPVENKPLLSSSVIERPPTTTAVSSVKPPDDLDPDFHRKEVAERYHKLRNKMIQQQGGFARTEEREEDSIVELEEDGEVKKISRFRAARLKGLGPQ